MKCFFYNIFKEIFCFYCLRKIIAKAFETNKYPSRKFYLKIPLEAELEIQVYPGDVMINIHDDIIIWFPPQMANWSVIGIGTWVLAYLYSKFNQQEVQWRNGNSWMLFIWFSSFRIGHLRKKMKEKEIHYCEILKINIWMRQV